MVKVYRGPVKPQEQPEVVSAIAGNYDQEEINKVAEGLYNKVVELLDSKGVSVINSSYRGKSKQRLLEKINRKPDWPVSDIYAVQIIVEEIGVRQVVDLIKERWPTVDKFPWSLPSFRDFSDPKTRRNEASRGDYRAIHMNVTFGNGKIGEIKIYTPDWLEIERDSRSYYEQKRRSLID